MYNTDAKSLARLGTVEIAKDGKIKADLMGKPSREFDSVEFVIRDVFNFLPNEKLQLEDKLIKSVGVGKPDIKPETHHRNKNISSTDFKHTAKAVGEKFISSQDQQDKQRVIFYLNTG